MEKISKINTEVAPEKNNVNIDLNDTKKEENFEPNDLNILAVKNEEDLKKYQDIIPEPSYPHISESLDKLNDLT